MRITRDEYKELMMKLEYLDTQVTSDTYKNLAIQLYDCGFVPNLRDEEEFELSQLLTANLLSYGLIDIVDNTLHLDTVIYK